MVQSAYLEGVTSLEDEGISEPSHCTHPLIVANQHIHRHLLIRALDIVDPPGMGFVVVGVDVGDNPVLVISGHASVLNALCDIEGHEVFVAPHDEWVLSVLNIDLIELSRRVGFH